MATSARTTEAPETNARAEAQKRREAEAQAAAQALDWLVAARKERPLEDCSDAEIAHVEEEWSCVETELLGDTRDIC